MSAIRRSSNNPTMPNIPAGKNNNEEKKHKLIIVSRRFLAHPVMSSIKVSC